MKQMKDSGAKWIGEIPAHWECIKGKYFLRYIVKPTREDDGVITCFRDGEVTLRSNRREEGFTMADKEIGYQGIDIGDLVVHGMDGFAGAIGISDSRGKASPVLNVLDTNQNKKYIMYYLRSMAYGDVFVALATGIRVRSCDLRWNKLSNLLYPIPPIDEQRKIAEFLDKKCEEVDGLITDIQTQIDTLEQYKRSTITEAVTKGLNLTAEMKDSGYEWIGESPKSWKFIRGRYLFKQRSTKGNLKNLELLSPSQKFGVVPQTFLEEMTTQNVVKVREDTNLETFKTIHVGDFCISLRSFQGGFEYSKYEGVVSSAYQVFYSIVPIYDGYYKFLFKDKSFIEKMNSYTISFRDGKNIAFEDFGNTYIPYPPIDEQKSIAEYLDKKCAEIDACIEEKKQQISVLETYKKSIIFEYVTGKKEVV